MPWTFNPFSGTFDQKGSGGGGSAFFAGEVATYADLPLDGTAALNSRWLVRNSSGTWPFPNYRQGGIYIRTSIIGSSRDNDYTLADTKLPDVFADSAFLLYDNSDSTRNLQFDLGSISTATTRTLTAPNASGTISLQGHTHVSANIADATSDETPNTIVKRDGYGNAKFNSIQVTDVTPPAGEVWLAGFDDSGTVAAINPAEARDFIGLDTDNNVTFGSLQNTPIGSTTKSTGSFTTLSATTSLTLGTSGILSGGTNTVEQRNTTSGQTFRLYNTVSGTADANYERGFLRWSSNILQIGTEKLGTGSRRTLEFVTDGTARWRVGDGSIFAAPSMLALGNSAVFGANEAYNVIIAAGGQGTTNAGVFSPNGSNTGYLAIGESLHLGLLNNGTSGDVRLVRDAANVLALRNGANTPQAYRIYNTFTSTTSFERLNIRWASNECIIDAEAGSGGGTLRGIRFGSATTSLLGFYNATPVAQPAAVADATDAATVITQLNTLLARLRTLGLIAT